VIANNRLTPAALSGGIFIPSPAIMACSCLTSPPSSVSSLLPTPYAVLPSAPRHGTLGRDTRWFYGTLARTGACSMCRLYNRPTLKHAIPMPLHSYHTCLKRGGAGCLHAVLARQNGGRQTLAAAAVLPHSRAAPTSACGVAASVLLGWQCFVPFVRGWVLLPPLFSTRYRAFHVSCRIATPGQTAASRNAVAALAFTRTPADAYGTRSSLGFLYACFPVWAVDVGALVNAYRGMVRALVLLSCAPY